MRLPAAVGDGLRALAAAHRVTPSTVFQAAWGVLLAGYSGARDVVFGTTVSGRPPTLDGALAMVGLFINTVPLRLRLPDDDRLGPWLAAIQLAAAAGRAFEHAASGQIQRWSALPPGAPLYETVVVYENYPEDRSRLAGASLDIDLDRARTIGAQTAYPVTLLIGERAGWSLKLITRRDRICAPEAAGLVAEFEALLARLAGDPARPLTEQLAAIARPPRIAPTAGRARPSQPPRDAVELQLAAIWRDVLGGAAPGVHDSFFELGGHSLLALELVRRIERELGVSLALAALLERPTIEGVAEAIRGAAAVALAPAIYLGGAARPRAPVPAAVFCVPGAAMDTISLHPIARAVGDAVPIYGLQPRGLDGAQPPWRTIEDTAAAHVAAIRAIQPAGPYRIAGHSYGAHVAYEIAQQLRAAGCEVAWLAVLDARARTTRDAGVVTARDDEARLGRLVSLVRRFVGRDLALPLDELRPLGPEQRIERVAAALAGAGVLPVELGVRRLGHYLRVGEATAAAFEGYLAGGRHPVRTLVIRARERHADDDVLATAGDDTLGWGALAAGDASVHWVAGDHVTMITGDHAGEVAAVLRGALVGRAEAA